MKNEECHLHNANVTHEDGSITTGICIAFGELTPHFYPIKGRCYSGHLFKSLVNEYWLLRHDENPVQFPPYRDKVDILPETVPFLLGKATMVRYHTARAECERTIRKRSETDYRIILSQEIENDPSWLDQIPLIIDYPDILSTIPDGEDDEEYDFKSLWKDAAHIKDLLKDLHKEVDEWYEGIKMDVVNKPLYAFPPQPLPKDILWHQPPERPEYVIGIDPVKMDDINTNASTFKVLHLPNGKQELIGLYRHRRRTPMEEGEAWGNNLEYWEKEISKMLGIPAWREGEPKTSEGLSDTSRNRMLNGILNKYGQLTFEMDPPTFKKRMLKEKKMYPKRRSRKSKIRFKKPGRHTFDGRKITVIFDEFSQMYPGCTYDRRKQAIKRKNEDILKRLKQQYR